MWKSILTGLVWGAVASVAVLGVTSLLTPLPDRSVEIAARVPAERVAEAEDADAVAPVPAVGAGEIPPGGEEGATPAEEIAAAPVAEAEGAPPAAGRSVAVAEAEDVTPEADAPAPAPEAATPAPVPDTSEEVGATEVASAEAAPEGAPQAGTEVARAAPDAAAVPEPEPGAAPAEPAQDVAAAPLPEGTATSGAPLAPEADPAPERITEAPPAAPVAETGAETGAETVAETVVAPEVADVGPDAAPAPEAETAETAEVGTAASDPAETTLAETEMAALPEPEAAVAPGVPDAEPLPTAESPPATAPEPLAAPRPSSEAPEVALAAAGPGAAPVIDDLPEQVAEAAVPTPPGRLRIAALPAPALPVSAPDIAVAAGAAPPRIRPVGPGTLAVPEAAPLQEAPVLRAALAGAAGPERAVPAPLSTGPSPDTAITVPTPAEAPPIPEIRVEVALQPSAPPSEPASGAPGTVAPAATAEDVALAEPPPAALPVPGREAAVGIPETDTGGGAAGDAETGADSGADPGAIAGEPVAEDVAPEADPPAATASAAPSGLERRVVPLTERAGGVAGVRVRRPPGVAAPPGDGASQAEQAVTPAPAEAQPAGTDPTPDGPDAADDRPALVRNAQPFEAPEGLPLLAVVLVQADEDAGDPPAAALPFPVSLAVDPGLAAAPRAAAAHAEAGGEVLLYGTALPAGATPQDAEVTLSAHFAALPRGLAVLERPEATLMSDPRLGAQVMEILRDEGQGVLLWQSGLNRGLAEAGRAGVPAALVTRQIDDAGGDARAIARALDRAVFEAGRSGTAVVVAGLRPETVAALRDWAGSARAAQVALAPVSAVLRAGQDDS